jgi:hypothetical protein
MHAIRLYMLGTVAQAWLEDCFAYFIKILASGNSLGQISRNPDIPGEGVLKLPDGLVERYASIDSGQIKDIDHLKGGCGCMARKYGFADGHLDIKKDQEGEVESIKLIIQA